MRATTAAFLCAAFLRAAFLPATALAGEATKPPKVLCLVKITGTDGLPLAPMGLVAFENGVYRLRTEDGREIEIAEKDVSSASFMPVKKPRPDKRGPREAEGRRRPPERSWGNGGRRPRPPEGRDNPRTRYLEEREKLIRLKQTGALGRAIKALEKRLRTVPTPVEAAPLVRRILAAKSVENMKRATEADLRALVETIERADIRESVKKRPTKYFLNPLGGPRGPRR